MNEGNLIKNFNDLKKEIVNNFKDYTSIKKILNVKLEILKFNKNKYSSYPYQRLKNIPAFYEHEKRSIVFNKSLLEFLNKPLVLNILYHEFLHAISFRVIKKETNKTILKSGFYIQEFSHKKRRKDFFKQLNEGVIQYLANKKTGNIKNSGYQKEAKIITQITKKINERKLKKLFFKGKVEKLKKLIEEHFGKKLLKKLA